MDLSVGVHPGAVCIQTPGVDTYILYSENSH